jgi:hypothetical protein
VAGCSIGHPLRSRTTITADASLTSPAMLGVARPVKEGQIIQLLESAAREYRDLAELLVPPLRSVTMNNRLSSEVALEVAAALDKLIAKIRAASTNL